MESETLIFKIIGFTKFEGDPEGEDDNDCIAVLENGTQILVDPFVGCAFKYDQREQLLGEWWEAEGHWYKDEKEGVFLPRENFFKKYKK